MQRVCGRNGVFARIITIIIIIILLLFLYTIIFRCRDGDSFLLIVDTASQYHKILQVATLGLTMLRRILRIPMQGNPKKNLTQHDHE